MSEGFIIRFAPYTFRGGSYPHGFEWRLFGPERGQPISSGLVFGDMDALKSDLPEPFDDWIKAGNMELVEVPTFKEVKPPERPKRPTGKSEIALRIYEARFKAYLKAMQAFNRMKGPDYV